MSLGQKKLSYKGLVYPVYVFNRKHKRIAKLGSDKELYDMGVCKATAGTALRDGYFTWDMYFSYSKKYDGPE